MGAPHPLASVAPPSRFEACIPLILAAEGGFVNDPRDPGGATNHGITRRTLAEWRGQPVSIAEVRALSVAEAGAIYRARYWAPLGCDALPAGVDLMVFDFGVNAGPARALRLLRQASGGTPVETIERYAAARIAYYHSLPGFAAFGRGWLKRVAQIRATALAHQRAAS